MEVLVPSYLELREDLKLAMKNKEHKKKATIRVILGELARLDSKEVTDDKITVVLKKLQKDEKLVIGGDKPTVFLEVIESYLPEQLSKGDILKYISTFDLKPYKNKMQAMGPIMKGLKGNANGNDVKEVLLNSI